MGYSVSPIYLPWLTTSNIVSSGLPIRMSTSTKRTVPINALSFVPPSDENVVRSSYCDLAPLYGHDQESGDKLRVRDGRGLLLPDTFAEDRLMLLPPAVCVLLVLFSRNHNVGSTNFHLSSHFLGCIDSSGFSVHCQQVARDQRAWDLPGPRFYFRG